MQSWDCGLRTAGCEGEGERGKDAGGEQVKATNLQTRKLTRSVSSSSFIVAARGPAMRRSGGAVTVAGRAERVDDEAGAADGGRWTSAGNGVDDVSASWVVRW